MSTVQPWNTVVQRTARAVRSVAKRRALDAGIVGAVSRTRFPDAEENCQRRLHYSLSRFLRQPGSHQRECTLAGCSIKTGLSLTNLRLVDGVLHPSVSDMRAGH